MSHTITLLLDIQQAYCKETPELTAHRCRLHKKVYYNELRIKVFLYKLLYQNTLAQRYIEGSLLQILIGKVDMNMSAFVLQHLA